jgi:hypothetical protein
LTNGNNGWIMFFDARKNSVKRIKSAAMLTYPPFPPKFF